MAKRLEVYKCKQCGNIIEILHGAPGKLKCCDNDMVLYAANTTEAAVEKHIPVISKVEGGYLIKVGEVDHPMTDEHYIEWIDLVAGDEVYRKFLKPGDKPEATFKTAAESVIAKAYCNLHGLWSTQ